MAHTLYYNNKRHLIDTANEAEYKIVIIRNPHEYPEDHNAVSAQYWTHIGSKIRAANFHMCRGSVSTGFFQQDTMEKASVIFLLYYVNSSVEHHSKRISETLIGFSLTNDLREERDDSYIEDDTLYIDVICVNSNLLRNPPPGGIRGAGHFLMTQIEAYAKMQLYTNKGVAINGDVEPFKIIKLSALPYVINFYRHFGFRHIHNCRGLRRDHQHGNWVEKNTAIRSAALQSEELRFKTDTELEHAMRIELAKQQNILTMGKHSQREKAEYLRQNLNEYFLPTDIKFVFSDHEHGHKTTASSPLIVAINPETDRIDHDITNLLYKDNSPMFRLLNELRKNKLSVELADEDTPPKSMRHLHYKDSDGDMAFHSLDEGFTMRKCLDLPTTPRSKSKTHSKSKSKRKTQGGGNKKWAGWANLAPKRGTQRNKMQKRCGNKCFLGPDKSFPICAKNTCKINNKGVWSAYIRARQQENMSKNKTKKRLYRRISQKSRKMLLK